MKLVHFLIPTYLILIAFGNLYPDAPSRFSNKPNDSRVIKDKTQPDELGDDELDKEFYTYYYMNLPKFLQKEEKSKSKLHTSLIKDFKKEISKRDRKVSQETLADISIETTKYKRVLETSKWMKKIKSEIRYIKFTEYMYIIKYKKYLALILYHLDPELHLQTPAQVEFIMVKDSEKEQTLD